MSLFGSALDDSFAAASVFDFLISFADDAEWGLLEHIQMEEELAAILSRSVDLVTRRAVERSHNIRRREHILATAQPVLVNII